jgi:hypothetical protein
MGSMQRPRPQRKRVRGKGRNPQQQGRVWVPKQQVENRYLERKASGRHAKRNAKRKHDYKIKRDLRNMDEMNVKGPWNQDRRNMRGCYWRPKRQYDNSPITWVAKKEQPRQRASFESKVAADLSELDDFDEPEAVDLRHMVPYDLTEQEQVFFKKIFGPDYKFGKEPHDHGLCAAVRYEAQKRCEEWIGEKHTRFYDAFGSARLPKPNKWSIMPDLTPHDSVRRRPEASCHCDPLNCSHWQRDSGPAFCVDVLYYLDLPQIHKLIKLSGINRFYTLHHSFNGVFANDMCGTYNWFNDGENVQCLVGKGMKKHTYNHRNMDWLNEKVWNVGKDYVHYEMITTYGPMEFGVFTIRDEWFKNKEFDVIRTHHVLQERRGLWLWARPEKKVLVDQKYYYLAKKFARGKTLDAKFKRDLISRLKRADLESPYSLIEKDFPEAWYKHTDNIISAVFCDLNNDMSNLQIIKENAGRIRKFNELQNTQFDEEKVVPSNNLFKIAIASVATYGVYKTGTAVTKFLSDPAMFGSMARAAAHAGFKTVMTNNPMAFFGNVFRPDICLVTDYGMHPTTPIRPPEKVRVGHSDFIKRVRANFHIEDGVRYYTAPKIDCSWNGECGCKSPEDRMRGILVLSSVEGREPFSFSGCESNIWFALRMRFMRDLPAIDTTSWELIEQDIKWVIAQYAKRKVNVSHKGWYNRWVGKFPENKRNKMNNSRDDPMPVTSSTFAATVCCKYEIGIMKFPLKPRAFFPKAPDNLVRNGPSMNFIKVHLTRLMNGKKTPFIFGPGHNSLQLGRAFENAVNLRKMNWNNMVSVELDLSMCETTMRGPFLVLEGDVYRALGLNLSDIDFLLSHESSYGKSAKRAFRFSMPFCRESGTANTTPGNTVVFATCLWAAFKRFGIHENNFVCLIGGDDACIYLDRSLVQKVKLAVDFVSKMGLKPEPLYHDNIWSGRFFSGRMVQVRLVGRGLTYCHIPLIGRCLAKNLCCKYRGQKLAPWLRDVTQGRVYEWEHVPVLRQVNVAMRAQYSDVVGACRIEMPSREINPSKIRLSFCDETFEQLACVYGVEVSDINALCAYMSTHFSKNWIGKTLAHEVIELMCDVDLK